MELVEVCQFGTTFSSGICGVRREKWTAGVLSMQVDEELRIRGELTTCCARKSLWKTAMNIARAEVQQFVTDGVCPKADFIPRALYHESRVSKGYK